MHSLARVWDGSDAHPKGNCAHSFLSRSLVFAFRSWDIVPFIFHIHSACELNSVRPVHASPSCNNTFSVYNGSARLYINPKQCFHRTSDWGLFSSDSSAFLCAGTQLGVLACTPRREARSVLLQGVGLPSCWAAHQHKKGYVQWWAQELSVLLMRKPPFRGQNNLYKHPRAEFLRRKYSEKIPLGFGVNCWVRE